MKVLAVIALLAVVTYALEKPEEHVVISANSSHFVGDLQDPEGGKIHHFGSLEDFVAHNTALWSFSDVIDTIRDKLPPGLIPDIIPGKVPSCGIPAKGLGNSICLAKCVALGHAAGYCVDTTCKCIK